MWAASARGVEASKIVASGSRRPAIRSSSEKSEIASSEWPPRAKKSSSTPTPSIPSARSKASTTSRSARVAGPAPPAVARCSGPGAGRPSRSTFPLASSGSAGSVTQAVGTIAAGRRATACRRRSARSGGCARVRRRRGRRRAPGRPAPARRGRPRRRRLGDGRAARSSISAGSTRTPRTLTWRSTRPRNSIAPSARQRTRSPLR